MDATSSYKYRIQVRVVEPVCAGRSGFTTPAPANRPLSVPSTSRVPAQNPSALPSIDGDSDAVPIWRAVSIILVSSPSLFLPQPPTVTVRRRGTRAARTSAPPPPHSLREAVRAQAPSPLAVRHGWRREDGGEDDDDGYAGSENMGSSMARAEGKRGKWGSTVAPVTTSCARRLFSPPTLRGGWRQCILAPAAHTSTSIVGSEAAGCRLLYDAKRCKGTRGSLMRPKPRRAESESAARAAPPTRYAGRGRRLLGDEKRGARLRAWGGGKTAAGTKAVWTGGRDAGTKERRRIASRHLASCTSNGTTGRSDYAGRARAIFRTSCAGNKGYTASRPGGWTRNYVRTRWGDWRWFLRASVSAMVEVRDCNNDGAGGDDQRDARRAARMEAWKGTGAGRAHNHAAMVRSAEVVSQVRVRVPRVESETNDA
ncbi:hypothetical protein B0H13DRAFT_2294388 [Mycena leptocephala]|nr:hypothetical protein B0H13DRAFT_2294388 [Mycena leptocephala]